MPAGVLRGAHVACPPPALPRPPPPPPPPPPWGIYFSNFAPPLPLTQAYDRCMPADVLRGIRGVDELRAKYGLRDAGLHGAVIEHLDVPEALHTAVDVIGGEGGRSVRICIVYRRGVLFWCCRTVGISDGGRPLAADWCVCRILA